MFDETIAKFIPLNDIVYNFNYLKWYYENNIMNVKIYKHVLSDMVIHISKWEKKP
jgi:hypothetical protein